MKKVINILILILFNLSIVTAQDNEFINLINQYRVKNNVMTQLVYDVYLDTLASNAVDNMFLHDSVYHSEVDLFVYEIVGGANMTPSMVKTPIKKADITYFKKFCKEYFDYEYNPNNVKDLNYVIKIFAIYNFHNSPMHRKNLLNNNITKVAGVMKIKDDKVVFVNNTSNTESFYKFKSYYAILFK